MTQNTTTSKNFSHSKPLTLKVSSPARVAAGEKFKVKLTIDNQGGESALIKVQLESIKYDKDKNRDILQSSHCEYLALNDGGSDEVEFNVPIAKTATPGIYEYTIKVQAPDTYEKIIAESEKLEITPIEQPATSDNIPTFTVKPYTSSQEPKLLRTGQTIDLTIRVDNRSKLVDKFYLLCPDIKMLWPDANKDIVRITYPQKFAESGLILPKSGLELNPGEQGEILLRLTVPSNSIARIYSPIIQLFSENNPNLSLLDMFYLQVERVDKLNITISSRVDKIRRQEPGSFELFFHNHGNAVRELNLYVESSDPSKKLNPYTGNSDSDKKSKLRLENPESWIYYFLGTSSLRVPSSAIADPKQVNNPILKTELKTELLKLQPNQGKKVTLELRPPQSWWRRSFTRKVLNFVVKIRDIEGRNVGDIEDIENIEDIEQLRRYGALIWEPRPLWHLAMLIIIIVAMLIGAIFLIRWLFLKPIQSPQILEFYPGSILYREINNNAVSLNWQISSPKKIKSIKVVGLSPDGTVISAPVVYDFSQGIIPLDLKDICNTENEMLDCQNVPTDARKAGSYNFELTMVYQENKTEISKSLKTNRITIEPIPQPKINYIRSAQAIYEERYVENPSNSPGISLNWEITNPQQIQQLALMGKSSNGAVIYSKLYKLEDLRENLKDCSIMPDKLVCKNVTTTVTKPGNYIFELLMSPQPQDELKPDLQKTDLIKINPLPPQIFEFKIGTQEAPPYYLVPQQLKYLNLSWKIKGSGNLKAELLPSPGTVPILKDNTGQVTYALSPNPTKEVITLSVTNEGGKTSRSVIVETVAPIKLSSKNASISGNVKKSSTKPDSKPLITHVTPGNQLPVVPPPKSPPPKSPPPVLPENNSLPPADLPPETR